MEGHGIQASSIGFMIDLDTPMVWRGPMVTQALEQLLRETNWRELDYLVVDMPPVPGHPPDARAEESGHRRSHRHHAAGYRADRREEGPEDVREGRHSDLGIIENMAMHRCSNCGHVEHIFGEGGGERMSKEYDVEYLGGLPLDIRIREQADSGKPTVVADPNGPVAQSYRAIARRIAVRIAEKAQDLSGKVPEIVFQDT